MTIIKIKPRVLTEDERIRLRNLLSPGPSDDVFERFAGHLELAIARYAHRWQYYQSSIPGAEAREACQAIGQAANNLRVAWNKAPIESQQLMDTAFQLRQLDTAASNQDERAIYQAALGELSEKSRPFLESVAPFLEAVIETAALASETLDDKKKGGRPRKLLMRVLASQIAHGFVHILEQQPTTTTIGPYSEVLYLAAELVSEQDKPSDLSKYVQRAVRETKETTARADSE